MIARPSEATAVHNRLLKCALEVENSRAYWAHTDGSEEIGAQRAFDEYWFGARSHSRVSEMVTHFRARFDAFPIALGVLHRWQGMAPDTRRVICHWHVQLAEPLYRAFAGVYLVERRTTADADVTRDRVVAWIGAQAPARWNMSTRIQLASKLLTVAHAAGLVASKRDPRPLVVPRVSDPALEYVMYLLRETEFEGSLLDNPYLASVGLVGRELENRLRGLPSVDFRRQGDLVEFGWKHASLSDWAADRFAQVGARSTEAVR